MRWSMMLLILLMVVPVNASDQQKLDAIQTATAVCTLQDGNQVSVRYPALPVRKDLRSGELWPPSSSPMFLFTSTVLSLGGSSIPRGAYSLYVIPEKDKWTLVINKAVSAGAPYQQQQDLTRQSMQIGQLTEPQSFEVAFAQSDKQCNMRIYYGKIGAWGAEFIQK